MADLDPLYPDQAVVHNGGVIEFGTQHLAIAGEEVRVYGERLMDLPEIQRLLRIFEMVIARHGRLFVLLIAGKVRATPSPEIRRCIAEWGRRHRVSGVALVGGTTVTRAVVSLTKIREKTGNG